MNKKVFALLFVFGFCRFTYADTLVSGYQTESATWTKENSPYILNNVSFDVGTTLIIEPGVTVTLSSGEDLNIFGDIVVNGSDEEPVVFTLADGAIEDADLQIFYSENSFFKHIKLLGIETNLYGSIVTAEHFVTENYSNGIRLFLQSDLTLSDFDIKAKDIGIATYEQSTLSLKSGNLESEALSWPQATAVFYDGVVDMTSVSIRSLFGTPLISFADSVYADNLNLDGGLQDGVVIYEGGLSMESSVIRNFTNTGLLVYGGNISVVDSEISNNTKGIEYYAPSELKEVSLQLNKIENNGAGVIAYSNSSNTEQFLDLRNNWWGDASGPFVEGENDSGQGDTLQVAGIPVLFRPWLNAPDATPEECCSSVAFLPGIQASRLYKKGTFFEDQLWEPNPSFTSDVAYLYLNQDGTSKNTGIYTRDVIDRTNIGGRVLDIDVYKTFIPFMDTLVTQEKIKEWKAFPYDWRFDYETILNNGIKYETYTQNLVDEIIKMASSSKTKKVSLVTHSNGGLLAKTLVNKLKSQGKENLIDQMILVAPPQLGTPKTIGATLHGEEQSNLIISKEKARGLGENMKSAYNLIPSQMYFDIVEDPVIRIASSTASVSNLLQHYGSEIDSYDELVSFLTASHDKRGDPKPSEVEKLNVLSSTLLNSAKQVHSQIDNWLPPENIDFIQVVGWGVFTTSGLEYFKNDKDKLDYKTIKTIDGDETVVTPSVTSNAGRTYYFDMLNYGSNQTAVKHVDIMEATDIKQLVAKLLTNSLVKLPEYISTEKPEYQGYQNMRIALHSPVSLGVYDNLGNYTGLKLDEESGQYYVEEGIPNSMYEEVGDGKYVYLFEPGNTRIELQGLGTGTFTLEVEKREGQEVIGQHVFSDIPTTANTEGELLISSEEVPILEVDIEGDGVIDVEVQDGEELSVEQYIALIKKTVLNLNISKHLKEKLIKRIEKIEKLLSKSKDKKVIRKIKDFNHKLKHLVKQKYNKHGHKKMTKADAEALMAMINELLDLLEQK